MWEVLFEFIGNMFGGIIDLYREELGWKKWLFLIFLLALIIFLIIFLISS